MQDIKQFIRERLFEIAEISDLADSDRLLGEGGVVDSMGVVSLCLDLEDLAIDLGFNFDWTSDSAMSQLSSMFSSIDALASEFNRQLDHPS